MDLEVRKINFHYGGKKILDDINFEAGKELIGVIGPNGSGKTTLLRNIDGVLKPDKGSIFIDGEDVTTCSPKNLAKKMGIVPQDSQIKFEFTALDVVLMGRNPYLNRFQLEGETEIEIAKRYMELTHCWHLAERPITELSGGEARKVIIARALTQEPKILLLDEPTSHLDLNHQVEIMDLIKDLSRDKVIIAALHDLNLAARYCDRLILLNNGKVIVQGNTEKILTRKNIKEVFGVDVMIRRETATDSYALTPVKRGEEKNVWVHVISGGGSGGELMVKLITMGFRVSAGVLNVFDTDYQTAKDLGVEVVGEAPFSEIGENAHEANLKMAEKADVVILADFPVGLGNLKNVDAAEYSASKGILTIVIDLTPVQQKDFTGKLEERWRVLNEKGAIFVQSSQEAIKKVDTSMT